MKRRLNLTVDSEVIDRAKALAHKVGTSVSQLVEKELLKLTNAPARRKLKFADQWMGKLKPAPRDPKDQKREHLWHKYGLTGDANSH